MRGLDSSAEAQLTVSRQRAKTAKLFEDETQSGLEANGFEVVRIPGKFDYCRPFEPPSPAMNFFNMVIAKTKDDNLVITTGTISEDYDNMFIGMMNQFCFVAISQFYFLELNSSQVGSLIMKKSGIDTRQHWTMVFPSFPESVEVPITFEASTTKIVFTASKYRFNLSMTKDGKQLKGAYTIIHLNLTDTIVFDLIESGKQWEGRPETSHAAGMWTIKAADGHSTS